MSKKPIFIEKINKFAKENPWINFLLLVVSLKEVVVWIWKVLVWVYNRIPSELVEEFFKKVNRFLKKPKINLKSFGNSVSEIIEKLKIRRGGDLNKSVLLYQAGSVKYGYNKLDESRWKDVYWLFRTNREDEWSEQQASREKLVDQVRHDFNLKRDEKKIKKYFRPIDELKRQLEWVDREMREIMTKNPHGHSDAEQKRLDELFVDESRLKTELHYSEMFSIIL